MAQPATNPKIEELRFRLKTDPKNRIFYPLAEELRKIGQFAEAEQVLRTGLVNHPTYLSAWVSLGRVSRELKNDGAAVEALTRALQLDPGNVVAARLIADAYLALGEKVEAIKKYKLVHALLPADEEIESTIARLETELNPPQAAPPAQVTSPPSEQPAIEAQLAPVAGAADESPFAPEEASPFAPEESAPFERPLHEPAVAGPSEPEEPFAPAPSFGDETATIRPVRYEPSPVEAQPEPALQPATPESMPQPASKPATEAASEEPRGPWATDEARVFADAAASMEKELELGHATADAEPMLASHMESPFEEPTSYGSAAFEVEAPEGMHVTRAPLAAEVAVELPAAEPPVEAAAVPPTPAVEEADVFSPAEADYGVTTEAPLPPSSAGAAQEDITDTLTMADLYARQGLIAEARQIYEKILQRDPGNDAVRQKLAAIETQPAAPGAPRDKVARLESWLAKVAHREVTDV